MRRLGPIYYSRLMFLTTSCPNVIPNPDELSSSINLSTTHYHILHQNNGNVNPFWVLLDNQSTVNIFTNAKILGNIHDINTSLKIYSTGGCTTTNTIGYLNSYGWVWYHPGGIANILSLSRVKKRYRVTFDSDAENEFVVHLDGNRKCRFKESEKVFYYSDLLSGDNETVLINTVA